MNSQISKLIVLVIVVVFFVVVGVCMIFLPSSENGSVEYFSSEGKFVITEDEPFKTGTWTADISYDDSSSTKRYVIENHPVSMSSDRTTCTITDPDLVNLSNHAYDIRLSSSSDVKLLTYNVTDHEYSDHEIITIVLVVSIVAIALVLAFVRRIVRGRW